MRRALWLFVCACLVNALVFAAIGLARMSV
jgi:hypothetical protein